MNKLEIAKTVVVAVVGFSTSRVAKQVIKNNSVQEGTIDKIAVPVACAALGGLTAIAAKSWAGDKFDGYADFAKEIFGQATEAAAEASE